jgi:diguanylate cyclase (GGDEF)-like protein
MISRLKQGLPLLIGFLMALGAAAILIRARYQLEVARDTAHLQSLLESVASELGAELASGERLTTAPPGTSDRRALWQPWHLDIAGGATDPKDLPPPVTESSLRRFLVSPPKPVSSLLLIGLFATDDGRNALVLAHVEPATRGRWAGSWAFLDDLMLRAGIAQLMRQGYRLQLYDLGEAAPWYQSDHGHLEPSVRVPLRFENSRFELRAVPRDGWAIPTRLVSSTCLLLLAALLWSSLQWRRDRALARAATDLAEAEARRQQLNQLYGQTLNSLAGLESRLQLVSMYDAVTGLANRSSLIRKIEATLDSMRQAPQGPMCVMAIGFDHVHHITNSFGADFASRVLVVAAERVEHVLPSKELLFRTGDFQLAAVLPGKDAAGSESLAVKIIEEIESPIALDSHTFMLHPTVGIAEASSGYEYPETLLDHAKAALDAVTRDAPTRYCLFDSAAAKDSISRLQLEVDLNRAFDEGQFVLEYEPFIVPASQAVAGFEALIRWNHPTEGRLSPARFVPIALQAGMAHRLNNWVIREAARQAAIWRRSGYQDAFINFNLSAEAFLRPNLAEEIGAVLEEFELPGSQLIIELTESTLLQDMRGAARTLQRLGELGVGAWLDDFGTGYSSLSHLRELPLKAVKIDRSFVERIDVDARDFGFLKALIDLISYLGMQSVAEGIETPSQRDLLELTACDLYQGYLFSRSMSAAQAERWMNENGRAVKQAASA